MPSAPTLIDHRALTLGAPSLAPYNNSLVVIPAHVTDPAKSHWEVTMAHEPDRSWVVDGIRRVEPNTS